MIHSIHGNKPHNWHTSRSLERSLQRISISKIWLWFESFCNIQDWFEQKSLFLVRYFGLLIHSLKDLFPQLVNIASLPNGSYFEHWDGTSCSWKIFFRRLLKDFEIIDFQLLLGWMLTRKKGY